MAPNGTSYTPGLPTWPDTQNSFVPVDIPLPVRANASPPSSTIGSTFDERLDVVRDRRLAEEADIDREGRLAARLTAVSLDRVEQRGLLTADVRARALAHLDVEANAAPEDVVAEVAGGSCGLDRVGDPLPGDRVLAAQVEVPALAPGREARDRHRLDERERIVLDHHPVFERARLALVGVGDEVVRRRCVRRNRLPLAAGRERGAATTDEPAARDLVDDGGAPISTALRSAS